VVHLGLVRLAALHPVVVRHPATGPEVRLLPLHEPLAAAGFPQTGTDTTGKTFTDAPCHGDTFTPASGHSYVLLRRRIPPLKPECIA
jgi:hypothetical protein